LRSFYVRRVLGICPPYFLVLGTDFFILPLMGYGYGGDAAQYREMLKSRSGCAPRDCARCDVVACVRWASAAAAMAIGAYFHNKCDVSALSYRLFERPFMLLKLQFSLTPSRPT
jgi:peptidoglycan/LPS O-acetylase OafA/YrhL